MRDKPFLPGDRRTWESTALRGQRWKVEFRTISNHVEGSFRPESYHPGPPWSPGGYTLRAEGGEFDLTGVHEKEHSTPVALKNR